MATKLEAIAALKDLRGFIGKAQLEALGHAMRGEEKQWFFDKLVELAATTRSMPRTYDTDGQGDQALARLHYFTSGADWHVTERDVDTDGLGQVQAFGMADLGHGPELGYVSIVELLENGAELDLHFKPSTLASLGLSLAPAKD